MSRPNILYLHSHDTGRYIQPYGHAVPTPNLQRLARQGVLFRQAYCTNPTCSPSRAAMLTGQYPHNTGMTGLTNRGPWALEHPERHILYALRQAGYRSYLAGLQHIAADRDEIGYDEVIIDDYPWAHVVLKTATEFLRDAPAEPFFLDVGFALTHRPFKNLNPEFDPRYTLPPPPFPDTPETREDMARFKTKAHELDTNMGAVLGALTGAGLADNTLVICTTDHGIAFPRMKANLTDGGIGVMLIMRGPDGFRGGRVVDALVSHVDLYPTLCEYLEVGPPEWLEGRSFMRVVRGEAEEVNDAVFAELNYHACYEPQRAARTKRWKYIRRFDERQRPVAVQCDGSLTKDVWLEHGWREQPVETEQLYDTVFDPTECSNRAGDPTCADVLHQMRARLDAWMEESGDPLLEGPIPAPSGARLNYPDATEHTEECYVVE